MPNIAYTPLENAFLDLVIDLEAVQKSHESFGIESLEGLPDYRVFCVRCVGDENLHINWNVPNSIGISFFAVSYGPDEIIRKIIRMVSDACAVSEPVSCGDYIKFEDEILKNYGIYGILFADINVSSVLFGVTDRIDDLSKSFEALLLVFLNEREVHTIETEGIDSLVELFEITDRDASDFCLLEK